MVHGAGQQRLFHRSGADIACAGHRGACHSSSGLSPLRWLSMLQHIKKALKTFKKSAAGLGPTQGGTEVEPAKHFPPEKAESLLWVGHKRPGSASVAQRRRPRSGTGGARLGGSQPPSRS